jgi:hypothetical protein
MVEISLSIPAISRNGEARRSAAARIETPKGRFSIMEILKRGA